MGCCVSTNRHTTRSPFTKSSGAPPPTPSLPPHPLEETVKEVLPETTKSSPTIPKFFEEPKKTTPLLANIQEDTEQQEIHFKKKAQLVNPEEISEIRQRIDRSPEKFNRRSFSGDFTTTKERGVAKSPARRSDPSPNRARPVPGIERRGIVPNVNGKDVGESSRRIVRSPSIGDYGGGTRQSLGRSPSVRKTGKSPDRGKSDVAEKNRKMEGSTSKEGKWPPTGNESLENPLVSLECFIFL